ncbi:MAG: peptide transporter [Verrucomicrobia bacterium]|nr:peptide transporter [Verrucomicrobiota bacterium]
MTEETKHSHKLDPELEEFRSLMEVPKTFEEGFSWASLVAALFVALLMVPGAMYMQLLAGMGVGPAAQWVTVILFIEVARRAHQNLSRPQVFVLFYMASAVMVEPFAGLLYNQFFAQSTSATGMGVTSHLPLWYAPTDLNVLEKRDFFMWAWMPAIGLVIFQTILGRLNSTVLSYGFFRLASDIEKLPFPMAPIGAQGIMALVEQQSEEGPKKKVEEGSWRWRVFSIGGILGIVFGVLYTGIPAVTSAMFGRPIVIFPIPFVDWTSKTADLLPAVATGLTLDVGQLVVGMVLPFSAMIGSFVGWIITAVANPLLYKYQILTSWDSSDGTVSTLFKNTMDFYFSFGIGVSLALAIVGIYQVVKGLRGRMAETRKQQMLRIESDKASAVPAGRGDIPTPFIVGLYIATSLIYILLSGWLVDWHRGVMIVLVFFAFLYTPLISYVTTRLEGMAGQVVAIPFIREAAFLLSGYTGGVKVWFLPIPMADYGQRTVFWRKAELTGTKFSSVWKAELILVPIVLISSIMFAQFIWSLAPIPGPEYPYTEMMWELNAASACIIYTSTLGRYSSFEQAFNIWYLLSGTGLGLLTFSILGIFSAPTMMVYGLIRGLNQTMPHVVTVQFAGALVGQYYFKKKYGKQWRQYIPVIAAGFSCGIGLITVFSVGINFLAKSVIKIPF